MLFLGLTKSKAIDWSQGEKDQLLASDSAVHFIHLAIELKRPHLNISRLSQMCGYKSRSYLREILIKKKNLNLKIANNLIESLQLDKVEAQYFLSLCMKDYKSFQLGPQISKHMKLKSNALYSKFSNSFDLGFENYFAPMVFAALGNTNKGVSLGTIQKRTNLEFDTISKTLNKLTEIGLVSSRGRLFFPQLDHAKSKGLGSKSFFKNYFLRSLEEAHKKARQEMDSNQDLFFSSHLLIKTEKVAELKKALRELLFEFVDENLEPEGDQVKNLVCSFI